MTNGGTILFQVSILNKNNYDNCSIKMKAFLGAQDIWEVVKKDYNKSRNDIALIALTQI